MQSIFDERQWLAWLVKVRILILTSLLGLQLAIAQLTPATFPLRLFITVILLWYTISVFYALLLSFWQEYRVQSLLQVLTDMVLVSLMVYVTGGVDSSFNFLYPLVIIVACILLPRVWAYLTAALAFILYGAVLELTYFAVIPAYSTVHLELKALQAIILINLFGYLAVAYLAGLLVSKLREVHVELEDTSDALEDLQALHENIIQSITEGLITTGLDGHVSFVNSAAEKLLEASQVDLIGKPIQRLFLDPLPQVDRDRAHAEVRLVLPNGFRKTFRVLVSALSVPERNTLGYVYTFDDLTEVRRLEREIRMQDRLAAVGRLAAAIAHEIRNPLTSIAGAVHLLTGIPDLSDEHRQLLQIVTRESERLNGIITDFLAYSRGRQYQFHKVNLLPLLEDTLTLLEHRVEAEQRAIRVERRFKVPEAWSLADGDKIKQVFWNFCENAVRAMPNGGTLTASVEPSGNSWEMSFADTGPGMSPQLIEKVFEPFQSQFEGGTGLGLAIVYQIVQAHEGKVWARSKPGQGCVFVLRLSRLGAAQDSATTGDRSSGLTLVKSATAVSSGGPRG
ncbi:MAG: PAS domain S-box protein [Acidobacteriaceae bacterium]|nr:PAS domain S-box protein [Acidobacteriaceae bacterium]